MLVGSFIIHTSISSFLRYTFIEEVDAQDSDSDSVGAGFCIQPIVTTNEDEGKVVDHDGNVVMPSNPTVVIASRSLRNGRFRRNRSNQFWASVSPVVKVGQVPIS